MEAFKVFDTDGDANIHTKQLKTVLATLNIHMPDEEMIDLLNSLGQDAPVVIDFVEFLYMMSLRAKSAKE